MCTEQIDFSLNNLGFFPPSIYACNNVGNDFDQDQYCVSRIKLLMCAPLTSKKTVAVG